MQRYNFKSYTQSYEVVKSSIIFTSIVHSTWTEKIKSESSYMMMKSTNIPPSTEKIGLMAEDIYALIGEGKSNVLRGDMVIAIMWRAIQDLIKEKKNLQSQINKIKERLDTLDSK